MSTLIGCALKPAMVVVAPDKFRGTASASEAAKAMAEGIRELGIGVIERPLADGGDGTLDAFGGGNRRSQVTGPLGAPVIAEWRFDGDTAIIEMARSSGIALVGGPGHNDPLHATTRGTGELIGDAISSGARRIIVGVGGSATTDGGLGAIDALAHRRFAADNVTVEVACDVTTPFLDAARVYAPQKGADESAVLELSARLRLLANRYRDEFGVDVAEAPYAGAAGGLAGGLLALGASLRGGFDLIADAVAFDAALEDAGLVVTGEGRLDATSFEGKVVGGVLARSELAGVPLVIVAGDVAPVDLPVQVETISLIERFGERRAFAETATCLREAVRSIVQSRYG